MENYGRWRTIRPLGKGGQGTVYLATDTDRVNFDSIRQGLINSIKGISYQSTPGPAVTELGDLVVETILRYGGQFEVPANCGAVKILHTAEDEEEYVKQLARMKREVKALRSVSHSNVVKILDDKLDSRGFVMEYFPEQPLSKRLTRYKGRFLEALTAFRPLVAAVAELHKIPLVHRDIKPDNVFPCLERGLVLSDFGIVYFADEQHTRVTSILENVGSRDWMPMWAQGALVEDVRPSFDVFSLGKLFWAMLSGQPKLLAWYHRKPKNDLEKLFPEDEQMPWANKILDQCGGRRRELPPRRFSTVGTCGQSAGGSANRWQGTGSQAA